MTLLRPEKDNLLWEQIAENGSIMHLRRSYRRRFALLAASVVGVLATVLFSTYLQSSNAALSGLPSSSPAGSSNSANLVYPTSAGQPVQYAKMPGLSLLKYSGATGVSPQWAPVPNTSGQIVSGGDIAVVDGTSARHSLTVDVSITNLANLAKSYSSFAFPLDIYEWCPSNTTTPGTGTPCGTMAATGPSATGNTAGSWVPYQTNATYGAVPGHQLFLTNAVDSLTVTLPKGFYYDLAMDPHQGSYYCISTTVPADLSPSFYVAAKAN